MIEVRNLTKRYGPVTAVEDLTFDVAPGVVTGFLGPNGAGKSTTMRMILGLDNPTSGTARINGVPYGNLRTPLRTIGGLLEARAVHPKRSAANHLRWIAASNGIPATRVDEVLELVGLTAVAGKPAGGFSLGMSQRLGLAQALLGDPECLLLDEPVNGLDPEGIHWVRTFLRRLASEGRTVLVSSHLLSEMSQTADHLIVIGRGRLIADQPTEEFIRGASRTEVIVRTDYRDLLAETLTGAGISFTLGEDAVGRPALFAADATTDAVGMAAYEGGIPLLELSERTGSLEDAFMAMTGSDVEYRTGGPASATAGDSRADDPANGMPERPSGSDGDEGASARADSGTDSGADGEEAGR